MPEYSPIGSEFRVNNPDAQHESAGPIVGLDGGGFLVSWAEYNYGNDRQEQKAQIYASNGSPIGEILLFDVLITDIAALPSGGFVVTYNAPTDDPNYPDIGARIYDSQGTAVGPDVLVEPVYGYGNHHRVAALADGGFVITWWDYVGTIDVRGNTTDDIIAQVFAPDGTGVGTPFIVNSISSEGQSSPTITGLADGGFVVSWFYSTDASADPFNAIKARVFNSGGGAVGDEFQVASSTHGDVFAPSVASLTNGGFVVAWRDATGENGDLDEGIMARVYGPGGAPVGNQFLVNSTTLSMQAFPQVRGLADGGFVITWTDQSGYDGTTNIYDIRAQAYGADASPAGHEILVNSTLTGTQWFSHVASLEAGGFAITWTDASIYDPSVNTNGVMARIFSSGTLFTSANDVVNFNALNPNQASAVEQGVSLYDALGDSDTVSLPNIANYPSVSWNPAHVFLAGTGNDHVTGGDGNDLVDLGSDNDTFFGSAGSDQVIGGDGADTFDYSAVNLASFAPGSVESLIGGIHPQGGPDYFPSQPDVLKLPGRPEAYAIATSAGGAILTNKVSGVVFNTAGIEKVVFSLPTETSVQQNNLLAEMLRLGIDAYQPAGPGRNWHPLSAIELGLLPFSPAGSTLEYRMLEGWYSAVDAHSTFQGEADAIVSIGLVDGIRTLSLAFRGTDNLSDFSDYLQLKDHYDKFKPLIDAIGKFVTDNGIAKILVSGHSLGGAMVQEFMATHSGAQYVGLTFGSPGSNTPNPVGSDSRIINFVHTDDFVGGLDWVKRFQGGARDGGQVYINSDVANSSSISEHSKSLYLGDFFHLLGFATDPSSPFASSALGVALANGLVYSGPDIQIAVGRPDSADLNSNSHDNFVLAGTGDQRIVWNSTDFGTNIVVDGGAGTDSLILPGNYLSWSWINVGSHVDLTQLTAKVGELWRVEKLVFSFLGLGIERTINSQSKAAAFEVSADISTTFVPVVWLDGRPASVQTPGSGATQLFVDGTVDYVELGDRDIVVTGSSSSDIIMLGSGQQVVSGGAGSDLINGVASNAQALLELAGEAGDDFLIGGAGRDVLTGGSGADKLSGGAGADTFFDNVGGLNGDTIMDFARGDRIVISDATLAGFTYHLTDNVLTYTGGSITLSSLYLPSIAASLAPEGGVQITFSGPPLILAAGPSVSLANGLAQQREDEKLGLSAAQADLAPAELRLDHATQPVIQWNESHMAYDPLLFA